MARETENIISGLKKERERSTRRIYLTFGPTAVINPRYLWAWEENPKMG